MGDTDPATQMRKIELSTSADMRYLITRISSAAGEKLNTTVPASHPSRQPVEALVEKYVNDIFSLAHHSISVNGNPALPPGQEADEVEPYDKTLAKEVHDTYALIERRTLEVAMLRREVPRAFKDALRTAIEEELRRDEVVLGKMREAAAGADSEGVVEVGALADGLGDTVARARAGLEEAKGRLPEVTSRLTRAKAAAAYVAEKGR